ncbi:MAG TPA: hypothetical protein VIF62_08405 [Labilithrix sp.]|jgi:hypothetical protein
MAFFARAVLGSVLFAATAIACGGAVAPGIGSESDAGPNPTTTSTTPPPPPTTTTTSTTPKPPPPPPAPYCPPLSDPSWTLAPAGFDVACTQDDDCEPAFFGTLACTDPKQALCECPNAAIAKTSDAAYQVAKSALDTQCTACRPSDAMHGCLCPAFKTRCANDGRCLLCLTGDTGCGL